MMFPENHSEFFFTDHTRSFLKWDDNNTAKDLLIKMLLFQVENSKSLMYENSTINRKGASTHFWQGVIAFL